ncbi:DUF2835 domain-containing protein [Aliidiomarina taiwanensis]|uniref:DUF2835 domain-containing protein n=1 Tax=Aliidiomarina taiwanensis TaxID=946228 RepID=A0A432X9M5_9GAMM|nr:DUF2835 family protein [Aliidiomarina taiwanensis]RUO44123.1 DUF2835 domain-containing protein [Aliidiomarina taiwanensis]
MNEYILPIHLTALETEQLFYGSGLHHIVVTAENGLRVQLALRHLVPFITRDGISGRFRLRTNAQHAFISLEKL